MKTVRTIRTNVDWLALGLYMSLVIFGWINIYAVSYEAALNQHLFDWSIRSGKQFLWIVMAIALFFMAQFFHTKFYQSLAYSGYCFTVLLLTSTLLWGVNVGGHTGWLQVGGIQLQPAEFAKLTCSMAFAKYLSTPGTTLTQPKTLLFLFLIVLLPVALILSQGDLGSSVVFGAFFMVLYREGLSLLLILISLSTILIAILALLVPQTYLLMGTFSVALMVIVLRKKTLKTISTVIFMTLMAVALIKGFHFFVIHLLKPHQQNRLKSLVNPHIDPLGIGWNVIQSKIAIGSGGLWGKGFLQGTQTKYGFVPEQSTDFIFCTIGEEYGWIGALAVISLFVGLLIRIHYLAERQTVQFAQIYGHAIAAILFFHFMINIGMTIGLMPVIGIPLPFISYGGSALCAFSAMLFILLTFDAERKNYL